MRMKSKCENPRRSLIANDLIVYIEYVKELRGNVWN